MVALPALLALIGLRSELSDVIERPKLEKRLSLVATNAARCKYLLDALLMFPPIGGSAEGIPRRMEYELETEFRPLLTDSNFWNCLGPVRTREFQNMLTRGQTNNLSPPSDAMQTPRSQINRLIKYFQFQTGSFAAMGPFLSDRVLWGVSEGVGRALKITLVLDLFTILVTGRLLVLNLFGLACIVRDGHAASRIRLAARALLTQMAGIVFFQLVSNALLSPTLQVGNTNIAATAAFGYTCASVGLVWFALCLLRPSRGPQDVISRVFLVIR